MAIWFLRTKSLLKKQFRANSSRSVLKMDIKTPANTDLFGITQYCLVFHHIGRRHAGEQKVLFLPMAQLTKTTMFYRII